MAGEAHPVPSRTRKLSPRAPMVLRGKPVGEQDVADQRRAFSFSLCASRRPRRGPTAAAGAPSSSRADRVCGHEPRRGLGRAPPEAACGEAGRACLNGRYHGGVAWRRNRAPLAEGTAVRVLPPGRLSRSGAAALDDYCRRSDAPVSLSAAPSFTLGGVVPHGPVSRQGITCFTPGRHPRTRRSAAPYVERPRRALVRRGRLRLPPQPLLQAVARRGNRMPAA